MTCARGEGRVAGEGNARALHERGDVPALRHAALTSVFPDHSPSGDAHDGFRRDTWQPKDQDDPPRGGGPRYVTRACWVFVDVLR